MRRHGPLRNTSTQSICIFCRLSGHTTPSARPRQRFLHNSRRPSQQAAARAPQQDAHSQPSQWTFDANSSLSPSEQQQKAHRAQLRQEAEERELARRRKQEAQDQEQQIRAYKRREEAEKARRQDEHARRQGVEQRRAAQRQPQQQRQERSRSQILREDRGSTQGGLNSGASRKQALGNNAKYEAAQAERARAQGSSQSRIDDRARSQQRRPSESQRVFRNAKANESKVSMPSFGGSVQVEEAVAGWGKGNIDVTPLQYKTEEQIREDTEAEAKAERDAKQARKEENKRNAKLRRQSREEYAAEQRQDDSDAPGSDFAPLLSSTKKASEDEVQYRATPLQSSSYRSASTSTPDAPEENTWVHLKPQIQDPAAHPPSPTPQQSSSSPTTQRRASPLEDAVTIDRNFQEHRRQRDARTQAQFSNPNIIDAASTPGREFVNAPARKQVRCARCLETGHHARECTGLIKCNLCGQPGHPASQCAKQAGKRRRNGEAQQDGNLFRRMHYEQSAEMVEGTSAGEMQPRARISSSKRDIAQDLHADRHVHMDSERTSQNRASMVEQASGQGRKPSEQDNRFNRTTTEAEQDAEAEEEAAERRARRSRRGFADAEEGEQALASKSLERRKEGRGGRRRESEEDADDEAMAAREERNARKAARKAQDKADQQKKKAERAAGNRAGGGTQVQIPEFVSVSNLAQQLGIGYEPFVQRLEQLGYDDVFPGKVLNKETSGMIAMEYDFDPVYDAPGSTGQKSEDEERDLKPAPVVEDTTFLPTRPPVVTIMGHVDHGKTTILDYLRRTSVAAGEAGGITQHIGAFSVPLSSIGKTITFLDTPGHAAFMSMRQRGANVTDMVILVVAADDSVKPQTLESIRCAREAGVPMIVAVNKVDKPEADVQRVKNDLSRHGVDIEDFGGEVQVVEVSGKTGQGLDGLEENIVTLSEILDHRSDTEGAVEGWVLEATTKRAGRVATVLVRRGTLRPGAILVAGNTWARVRSLRDERDQSLTEVGPGMPVEVDGWRDQPVAGDEVLQTLEGEQKATDVVAYRLEKGDRVKMEEDMEAINSARRAEQDRRKAAENAAAQAAAAAAANADGKTPATDPAPEPQEDELTGQQTVPLIVKADVSGSAEAVSAYIPSLTSPLITPDILTSTVGPINESDVELASASGGHIVAFNLPKNEDMRALAETKGVKVLENNVIYRVLDMVREVMEERLPMVVTQKVVGEAEVGQVFEIGVGGRKKVKIAGCKVRNGAIARNARVRVLRGAEKIYDGTITSLKNVKKDVQEMRKGTECGMGFEEWEGFQEGDSIQTFEEVREKRKL